MRYQIEGGSTLRRTLEVLQDRTRPRPFAEVRRALEKELGAPLETVFASFEEEAAASASLAQARPLHHTF